MVSLCKKKREHSPIYFNILFAYFTWGESVKLLIRELWAISPGKVEGDIASNFGRMNLRSFPPLSSFFIVQGDSISRLTSGFYSIFLSDSKFLSVSSYTSFGWVGTSTLSFIFLRLVLKSFLFTSMLWASRSRLLSKLLSLGLLLGSRFFLGGTGGGLVIGLLNNARVIFLLIPANRLFTGNTGGNTLPGDPEPIELFLYGERAGTSIELFTASS